uniref:Uncharacterized protein n=1 Tax=Tetraselmis sp. GSL018 TaxID=582737 RepID=A0A061QN43_9CHLO
MLGAKRLSFACLTQPENQRAVSEGLSNSGASFRAVARASTVGHQLMEPDVPADNLPQHAGSRPQRDIGLPLCVGVVCGMPEEVLEALSEPYTLCSHEQLLRHLPRAIGIGRRVDDVHLTPYPRFRGERNHLAHVPDRQLYGPEADAELQQLEPVHGVEAVRLLQLERDEADEVLPHRQEVRAPWVGALAGLGMERLLHLLDKPHKAEALGETVARRSRGPPPSPRRHPSP